MVLLGVGQQLTWRRLERGCLDGVARWIGRQLGGIDVEQALPRPVNACLLLDHQTEEVASPAAIEAHYRVHPKPESLCVGVGNYGKKLNFMVKEIENSLY